MLAFLALKIGCPQLCVNCSVPFSITKVSNLFNNTKYNVKKLHHFPPPKTGKNKPNLPVNALAVLDIELYPQNGGINQKKILIAL